MLSSHCENMLAYAAAAAGRRSSVLVDPRRYRPNVEVAPNCPRCDSPNTKFCYYNNYSLSQPRYFCKGCRRYWTKGGSLRNVPVGGGCRKNRRGSKSSSSSARPMADDRAAAAHDHGPAPAAFSHRFHGPVRPDLLLEGMAGNPPQLGQPAPSSANKPAAAAGSMIDLALLYSKFLSHQPANDVPESVDTSSSGSSSATSPGVQPGSVPAQAQAQHGFGKLCRPATASTEQSETTAMLQCADVRAQALGVGELAFSVDQSCYDSLGLPTDGGDLILPSTWDQGAKYEPFDSLPVPEDAMSLHGGGPGGGDDVWSKVLGSQGLEAALCRP